MRHRLSNLTPFTAFPQTRKPANPHGKDDRGLEEVSLDSIVSKVDLLQK